MVTRVTTTAAATPTATDHSGHHDPTKPPATPADTVATGVRTVASTEHLPVLSLSKIGPATADAGTTATYGLTVGNAGDATGSRSPCRTRCRTAQSLL